MPQRPRKKRMTQAEVINHFSETTGLKRAQVKELFEEYSKLAAREVQKNGEFTLPGLGKLVVSNRKARQGRNPATGEIIQIAAKTTVKFRIKKSMKNFALGGDSPTQSD
jgi:DNA-binding protein HU-beta